MLIGMRNAMLAGGGWKNPYITDGLVAMYDGIWNNSPDSHSTDKVCNNIVADMWHGTVGNNVEIGDNYFGFSGERGIANAIKLGDAWFGKPEHMTVEVCFVSTGAGAQSTQCCLGGTENSSSGFSFFNSAVYCLGSFSGAGAATKNFYISSWAATSNPQTLALTVGSSSSFVASNATIKAQKSGGTLDWSQRAYNCFIGCDYLNPTEYHLKGKVYCVRVYDRALTLDALAANNAIDKARFGL